MVTRRNVRTASAGSVTGNQNPKKGKGKNAMKITIDRDYTTISQAEKVKEDIKEFKARYTDGDLKRAFCDALGIWPTNSFDILMVTGKAFPGGFYYNDETHFSIEIIAVNDISCILGFCKMHFYCDMELNIDTRELGDGDAMYSCEIYEPRK